MFLLSHGLHQGLLLPSACLLGTRLQNTPSHVVRTLIGPFSAVSYILVLPCEHKPPIQTSPVCRRCGNYTPAGSAAQWVPSGCQCGCLIWKLSSTKQDGHFSSFCNASCNIYCGLRCLRRELVCGHLLRCDSRCLRHSPALEDPGGHPANLSPPAIARCVSCGRSAVWAIKQVYLFSSQPL